MGDGSFMTPTARGGSGVGGSDRKFSSACENGVSASIGELDFGVSLESDDASGRVAGVMALFLVGLLVPVAGGSGSFKLDCASRKTGSQTDLKVSSLLTCDFLRT